MRTGSRCARPSATRSTQGDADSGWRTASLGTSTAFPRRATSMSTETVMSCFSSGGGSGTSSLTSTAPVWAFTPGLM